MSGQNGQAPAELLSANNIAALFDSIDAFLFDCDGVIWKGDKLIDGVRQTLDVLRSKGKKLIFVTNNSRRSRRQYAHKFHSLGVSVSEDEIFSSSFAAAMYLKVNNFPQENKVYVIGGEGILEELRQAGYTGLGGPEDGEKRVQLKSNCLFEHDKNVGAVVVGLDSHINYYKLQYGTLCIRENPGCLFIATNCDAVGHLTDLQGWPGAGCMVAAMCASSEKEPIVVGKPSTFMMEILSKKFQIASSRMCMVGDRLDTDILFGQNAGCKTLLVLSGVTTQSTLQDPSNNIQPDYYTNQLVVRVIEARNIPAMDQNGYSDPYVRLQLGRQRFKTKVVKKTLSPSWEEEFSFKVEDLKDELVISVLDEDKYFNDDFVGFLKIPVSRVFDADNKSLPTAWHSLQPKNKKSKNKDCGEILLTISFSHNTSSADFNINSDPLDQLKTAESPKRSFSGPSNAPSPVRVEDTTSSKEEKSCAQKTLAGRIAQMFNKNSDTASGRGVDFLELPETTKSELFDDKCVDQSSSASFEEAMKTMESRDLGSEVPSNLPGGVLVDQMYVIAPQDLNTLLFSPDSNFPRTWAEEQGNTELQIGPWRFENGCESLKRVVTYIKAANKLIKATKGFEEQTYLKADGKVFAILASVSTPEVMYGGSFRTELLFCITPGPELSSGEQSSHLVISWRMNFLQSTMMKGMIENGARSALRETYEQFATFLSLTITPVDSNDMGLNKEQILASLQPEPQSDWKLAVHYFANFTVVSLFFMGIYVLVHIWLATSTTIQGLEFVGLDLPDSIGEFIVCGVLVLQGERFLQLISRFMQARKQKGSDHGVKAQGDGWLLTVALIKGDNLAAVDSSGFCDPYVVFACNGKSRTSSIKFQQCDPMWNEIFEFDAMDEPPSMLDVEVYDFDGPFNEATSLGHAEINFLKSNISDLADVWIPLQGKLAQACQSKLHLRIFLNNTKGSNVVKEYLTKMEKEVGKKINLRSPQTNSAFQKLFGLPAEEFLINDFTCHLKRKMLLQGRLFLSARIIGFHANLFGHKTNFFFLWEDIEDIQVLPPSLSSMGSPVIVMTLRQGRGMDARHGAKIQDEEGRLKFHFHSFVSYNVAHRTIMALWKARSLSPEQKVQIVEESEAKSLQSEESGTFLGLEDVPMSEVYSSVLPVPISFFMELFGGGELERTVMEKAGCVSYSCSPWESEKLDVYERQIYYRFDKCISRYRGEVTSTQQKSPLPNGNGWLVEEVMTLHGVPLGDYFNLQLRYQVEDSPSRPKGCLVQVYLGVAWLKSTRHQKRITKNIVSNLEDRLRVKLSVIEKEFAAR